MQEGFKMSEQFFGQVLESLEDYAVITIGTDGNINSWNKGAEKLLKYSEKEIIGKSASVFFTDEDTKKGVPEQEMKHAVEQGKSLDVRYHKRKDGSLFWGNGMMYPLYNEQQQHLGFTKIMRDLTEAKKNEEILNNQMNI